MIKHKNNGRQNEEESFKIIENMIKKMKETQKYDYIDSRVLSFTSLGIPALRLDILEKKEEKTFILINGESEIILSKDDAMELRRIFNQYMPR